MSRFPIIRRIVGTTLFILGIIGVIFPILPGLLLIGIGLYFLSLDSPGMQSRITSLRERYAFFDSVMVVVEKRLGKSDKDKYTDDT